MADPDDLGAHISSARVLSEQVTSFRALLAALDEARGFPEDLDESKALHTHSHLDYHPATRDRVASHDKKFDVNPDRWRDKKHHLRTTANRQYDRVKSEFRLAMRDVVFGWQKGKYSEKEFEKLGRAAFDKAYEAAFRLGLKASGVALLDHPRKRKEGPQLFHHDERWLKGSLRDERKYWNKFMLDVTSGAIAAKRFTAAERIDMYADTLDHVYDAARVVGHPSHSIIYWVMHKEKEHCVAGDELVSTPDGLLTLEEAIASDEHWFDGGTSTGWVATHGVKFKGIEPVVQVTTHLGYSLRVTEEHRFYRWGKKGFEWVEARHLTPGDQLLLRRGTPPAREDHAWAELLGMIDGDGWVYETTTKKQRYNQVGFLVEKEELHLVEKYNRMLRKRGLPEFHVHPHTGSEKVLMARSGHRKLFDAVTKYGLKGDRLGRGVRELPPVEVAAYLRGLFEADGYVQGQGGASLSTAKEGVARDVQQLLLSIGILSKIRKHVGRTNYKEGRTLFDVDILGGTNLRIFTEVVGFAGGRKTALLASRLPVETETRGDTYPIPLKQRTSVPVLAGLCETLPGLEEKKAQIRALLSIGAHFGRVESVNPAGVAPVYDVVESPTEAFLTGGFVVHNCPLCLFLQQNSPYTRETLPGVPRDGNTCMGLSRCGCELRIITLDDDTLWQKLRKRSRDRLTRELSRLKKLKRSAAMDSLAFKRKT